VPDSIWRAEASTEIFPWPGERTMRRDTMSFSLLGKGAKTLATDKIYKAEYVGSGTFLISKPKRKKSKQRQSNLKNVARGSRK
jgi:hypothetical protein